MTAEITDSMHQLLDHLVEQVPGVTGALVSSADGFVLASRLPDVVSTDAAGLGAMSSAAVGLSNRLVEAVGGFPATFSHHRSPAGQIFVFAIAHLAVLTVLATTDANVEQLQLVGREAGTGLQRLFRGAATV